MRPSWNNKLGRPRREKKEIIADLVRAVQSEQGNFTQREAVLTRVYYKIRVPYTRFRKHLTAAVEEALVRLVENRLFITHMGEEFLVNHDKVLAIVGRAKDDHTLLAASL